MPHTHSEATPFRRPVGLVARVTTALTQAITRRRDRIILSRLDAHLLRDIGVDADRAADECAKPFWRP